MPKKQAALSKHHGFFALIEIEFLNEKKQVKERKFVKTGYLEGTADKAFQLARARHPGARLKTEGVRVGTAPWVTYHPIKKDDPDYTCFSSVTGKL